MVTIREVKTERDRRIFSDFPNKLYRDVPQYMPPLATDDREDWNPKKNPAFSYCDVKAFLAERDGKVVGRIGAILNHRANEKWRTNRMRFSQLDFIDDPEVSDALFGAVEAFAREKGCDSIHGPLGFTDLDREGMLVEGFDQKSMFITYYNYPYYIQHLERLGYAKDVDWVEFLIDVPTDARLIDRLGKLSDRVLAHNRLHVAEVKRRRDFQPYVEKVFRLWNTAYAPLYGTTTLDDTQVKRYVKKFLPMIDPRLACFVMDEQNELVAFGVSAPSIASALKKSNGRLFPFGFVGVLRALRHNDTL
ncbi:MAG: hypothetical protein SOR74_08715, partial [Candidatus Faecivicinus sp.]|nr:hypothetical protein [Candidatus Faecivicinus sp.]